MFQTREQDKTPEQQLSEVETGSLPEKDSSNDPRSQKTNGGTDKEDIRNV